MPRVLRRERHCHVSVPAGRTSLLPVVWPHHKAGFCEPCSAAMETGVGSFGRRRMMEAYQSWLLVVSQAWTHGVGPHWGWLRACRAFCLGDKPREWWRDIHHVLLYSGHSVIRMRAAGGPGSEHRESIEGCALVCFFAGSIAAWCQGRWGSLPGTEKEEVSLRGLSEAESGSCKHQGWIVPWEDRHGGQQARGMGRKGGRSRKRAADV